MPSDRLWSFESWWKKYFEINRLLSPKVLLAIKKSLENSKLFWVGPPAAQTQWVAVAAAGVIVGGLGRWLRRTIGQRICSLDLSR